MTDARMDHVSSLVRDVVDFPKPGIVFKDLTPVFADARALREVAELFAEQLSNDSVDVVAGVEARGFVLGAALAMVLGKGFVPVRKAGKLPRASFRESYALEYGSDALEVHQDAFVPGASVVLVDDVLATGGTAAAAARLVERAGGRVARLCFLLELGFLEGSARLGPRPRSSLLIVP